MEPVVYAFIKGFLFSIALCLDLGVVNIAIMKTGLDRGFAASFRIGLGSCFGDVFYMSLALLGWTAVFHYLAVQWILWIGGTMVLLWLTFNMLRDTIKPKKLNTVGEAVKSRSAWSDLLVGAGLALSSPTLILSFVAIAGPVVADLNIQNMEVLMAFVAGFVSAGVLWSLMIALLGSQSRRVGTSALRILSLLSALLFLGFAVSLFWDGLHSLIL
ncbi:LysE family translocator [Cohnella sp.]|uniref:LysE family translocator n=1 Tax=Cohnella sp. TaxID=1883426 RepID=UPI0035693C72